MKHAVIYKGPSLLDNEQIVVIATYSDRNTKTGKVVQTKSIGATKEKTPHRIANDYKNVNMEDPEIAKYFE